MPKVTFINTDEIPVTVEAHLGSSLLEVARRNDIDMEGACDGSLACSTCHGIIDPKHYDKLPAPSEEENDMLDMAFGITPTSRLCCQIRVNEDIDGIIVRLPKVSRNITD